MQFVHYELESIDELLIVVEKKIYRFPPRDSTTMSAMVIDRSTAAAEVRPLGEIGRNRFRELRKALRGYLGYIFARADVGRCQSPSWLRKRPSGRRGGVAFPMAIRA